MIQWKSFIFTSIILSITGISFFTMQNSIKDIVSEKSNKINLSTAYVKQKIDSEKKLSFLTNYTKKDYKVNLLWRDFFFDDKKYIIYGWTSGFNTPWKKYIILKKDISEYNEFDSLSYSEKPIHFLLTKNYSDQANSCNKGSFLRLDLLEKLAGKIKDKKININLMVDSTGNPITKEQIKTETNLNVVEGELLDVLLSNKKCFFSNEGTGLQEYVFIPVDFMLNTLKKRGAYLASKEVVDVRKDNETWQLLGFVYPRNQVKDSFPIKDVGWPEKCTINYSYYNNCILSTD